MIIALTFHEMYRSTGMSCNLLQMNGKHEGDFRKYGKETFLYQVEDSPFPQIQTVHNLQKEATFHGEDF